MDQWIVNRSTSTSICHGTSICSRKPRICGKLEQGTGQPTFLYSYEGVSRWSWNNLLLEVRSWPEYSFARNKSDASIPSPLPLKLPLITLITTPFSPSIPSSKAVHVPTKESTVPLLFRMR
jgi:hypothetical protein